jgi:hypothetical protein
MGLGAHSIPCSGHNPEAAFLVTSETLGMGVSPKIFVLKALFHGQGGEWRWLNCAVLA